MKDLEMEYDADHTAVLARVADAHLGFEDHGIYTVALTFDFGSSSQSTGHRMATFCPPEADGAHVPIYGAIKFIIGTMTVLGDWPSIKGKECLVLKRTPVSYNAPIVGIAQLPTRGKRAFFFDDAGTLTAAEVAHLEEAIEKSRTGEPV